jgi:hypothetical protein
MLQWRHLAICQAEPGVQCVPKQELGNESGDFEKNINSKFGKSFFILSILLILSKNMTFLRAGKHEILTQRPRREDAKGAKM